MSEEKHGGGPYLPMDTTSLYYFRELTKDLHMTRTAERLYISQQTLSNHILRLEKQLGCRLFNRKPFLSLTYAGEQVLSFAERTIKDQLNLQDILSDVENQNRGAIRFGASTLRMNACLPVILPAFSAEYPNVELQITDQTSKRLEPMVIDGELDFALVAKVEDAGSGSDKKKRPGQDDPVLIWEHMISDPVYLCVSYDTLHQYLGSKAEDVIAASKNGADLNSFRNVPFMLFQNRLGLLINRCFQEAGFEPHVYIMAPYTQIITRIGLQGTAAFFSTAVVLSSQPDELPSDLHVFPLMFKGEPLHQEIYLLRNKDRFIPRYANRFLELLKECFRKIEDTPLDDSSHN